MDDGLFHYRLGVELAEQLSRLPQRCLLSDRRSVYEQWDLPFQRALENEFRLGLATIESEETSEGVRRFIQGSGRHGAFYQE